MKLLYLHQHFTTPQGASGTRSYEMARYLISLGHEVTIVCGSFGAGKTGLSNDFVAGRREGHVDGIRVVEFLLPYSNKDGFLKRIWTFLKFSLLNIKTVLKEDYDLLFATSTPLTVAIPTVVAKWLRRKPYVFEVRDLWPELPREMGVIRNPLILWGMGLLETAAYRSANACIGLSPGIVAGIEKKAKPELPIAMVPNGCDLELFAPAPSSISKADLGFAEEDFVAVFTGTHGQANGLDKLVEVAKLLKQQQVTGVKLLLVGDGKLKPELQQAVQTQGLQDYMVFRDPIPKLQLAELMHTADLGLMILANVPAFYFGTSPNKFFDYIAAGLPVLNNYPGWLAQMIDEHRCGAAVPPDDAQAFVDALLKLKSDPEQLKQMGHNARQLAERDFQRPKLAQQFAEFVVEAQRGARHSQTGKPQAS